MLFRSWSEPMELQISPAGNQDAVVAAVAQDNSRIVETDIPARDPTVEAAVLQRLANCQRGILVSRGIADEDRRAHTQH